MLLYSFIRNLITSFHSVRINLELIAKHVLLQIHIFVYVTKNALLNSPKSTFKPHTTKTNSLTRDFVFLWKSTTPVRFGVFTGRSIVPTQVPEELSILASHAPTARDISESRPTALLRTLNLSMYYKDLLAWVRNLLNKSFGFGFYYIQGFMFVLFVDACLTDDEPLWEPIEWSLVQTWILFIFTFAWIAENLIVSRYGSYTGRDKRVWMSWYKTFWLIEGYYILNYGVAIVFVIIPFYFETNYNLSFVYSWWHWYSRVFFFKFMSVLSLVLYISYYLQISIRWINWRKGLFLVVLVNIFLSYLIYTQFIITFLGFFTDPVWYQKTRPVDYIQLSHEPARWGWGSAKKDHFTYHNVKTVFWFKNDGPFAAAMLMFQIFLFLCIFLLYIYWITLFRRIYATKEIPLTLTTYCVSSLRQFFYFSFFMYLMVFMSYIINYSRLPIEFLWTLDGVSWSGNLYNIVVDYPSFILSIFL